MDTIEHMTYKWFIRWWATICFFLGMGVVFVAHTAPMKPIDADIKNLEETLAEKLGAKVLIQHTAKGKGRVVLKYNSLDELDGILSHIK